MIVYDGENCVLGRVASQAAKKLIEGEEVVIVNAEKMVITGSEDTIMEHYLHKMSVKNSANPKHSPSFSRRPDYLVKKTITGMLPSESPRKQAGARRLMAFIGVPKEYEGKATKICELTDMKKRHVTIEYLSKKLGWKG
jgi:ribosomal protein uL13